MINLTNKQEVGRLFSNIDKYYQTPIVYNFDTPISNDTLEYLEDSFPRTNHFNEFINYSDTYEITNDSLIFLFEETEEYYWMEGEEGFFPNPDCYETCLYNLEEPRCRNCRLTDFKNVLYEKLINLNDYDDLKCILGCGFINKNMSSVRDLSDPGTLYCRLHSSNFSADLLQRHRENLKKGKLNEYNEIIDFLNNPLPPTYELFDEDSNIIRLSLK